MKKVQWLGFAIILMMSSTINAEVYKYVDHAGNVFFSDEPLQGQRLHLEWKRSNKHLIIDNHHQSQQLSQQQRRLTAQQFEQRQARSVQILQQRHNRIVTVATTKPIQKKPAALSIPLAKRRALYQQLIERVAQQHRVWPELLHAVIRAESAYRADALSHAGACGLMQLMPATADRFHVNNIWDPAENIQGGARYLRFLLDLFENDLQLTLAAYNAGENAVKQYGNTIPPYPETQNYVRKVLQFLHQERTALNS
jgi:soluble lytic murein transglycosylase-like protein